MGEHSIFDWVSVLGPMLLSWPLLIAVVLIFFRQPIFGLLERISDRNVQKAKIGPFEIEDTKQLYVDSLKLLFTSLISDKELNHLQQLNGQQDSYPYRSSPKLIEEIKNLHSLGFISTTTDLKELPDEGDFKHHLELTEKSKKYLALREKLLENQLEQE